MNNALHQLVRNWLHKAENDLKIGQDQMETAEPTTDMVCYHMQQCVEKYLRAYLALNQKPFRRTHDIAELIEQCKEIDDTFDTLYKSQVDSLTIYGVEIRYPDDFYMPTRQEAETCVQIALVVRDFVRAKLPSL
jgi:HEPN domain-containing protein